MNTTELYNMLKDSSVDELKSLGYYSLSSARDFHYKILDIFRSCQNYVGNTLGGDIFSVYYAPFICDLNLIGVSSNGKVDYSSNPNGVFSLKAISSVVDSITNDAKMLKSKVYKDYRDDDNTLASIFNNGFRKTGKFPLEYYEEDLTDEYIEYVKSEGFNENGRLISSGFYNKILDKFKSKGIPESYFFKNTKLIWELSNKEYDLDLIISSVKEVEDEFSV